MRVADYIFKRLADFGVRNVFVVTGGGAMHLNDALAAEPRIKHVCTHHEQAAAFAAEGYARSTGELAVVSVTSGPGGTNAMTGVYGQWVDSAPVLYLSGQVKFETTLASHPEGGLRQLGDQEIDIISLVKPITKYAKMVTDPQAVRLELEKALHLATTGRPGPVWLDIPLNVQAAQIDERGLTGFVPTHDPVPTLSAHDLSAVVAALCAAKRPLLIAGHGISLAKARKPFATLVEAIGIPVVTTFNGFDLIGSESENFVGRIGTLGSRGGNFALQNADLVLCVGTRNNIRQISYNWAAFAKNAKKVLVDIDAAELHKPTVRGDILVHSDAGVFINGLLAHLPREYRVDRGWLDWCQVRRHKYPVVLEAYRAQGGQAVHPYPFLETLTSALDRDATVVAADGSACVVLFQAGVVKTGQRIFWNSGCAAMGFALSGSIGAALATKREVICIEGDGSVQLNLQEFQTIRHYNLPIKTFILNNGGYQSIKQTQNSYFNGNFIGCDAESGLTFPDNEKLAALYDLKFFRISDHAAVEETVREVLAFRGPVICDVVLDRDYVFSPKLSSKRLPDGSMVSKPLEDLFPFLDADELASNMIVRDEDADA